MILEKELQKARRISVILHQFLPGKHLEHIIHITDQLTEACDNPIKALIDNILQHVIERAFKGIPYHIR